MFYDKSCKWKTNKYWYCEYMCWYPQWNIPLWWSCSNCYSIYFLIKIGDVSVIRSRDLKFLEENTDLLVDIGGGKFDHHQKGGNGQRENGIKYASAGLIWKEYGSRLIAILSNNMLNSKEISEIANVIDQNIIQNVDMEDNGQLVSSHPFQFITSFLPSWNKESNYDEKFEECVNIVSTTFENIIESYISLYLAKKEIYSRITSP